MINRFSSRWHLYSPGAKASALEMAALADKSTMAVNLLDVGPGKPRREQSMSYMAWTDKMSSYKTLDINQYLYPDYLRDITKHTGIPDNSFDVVVCCDVLEHLFDFKGALKEMHRICRGMLVINIPFVCAFHEYPNDFWRISYTAMEKLLADWEHVETRPIYDGNSTWAIATDNPKFHEVFFK